MTGETRWASDNKEESPFYVDNSKPKTEVKKNYSKKRDYSNYDSDLDREFFDSNDFGSK